MEGFGKPLTSPPNTRMGLFHFTWDLPSCEFYPPLLAECQGPNALKKGIKCSINEEGECFLFLGVFFSPFSFLFFSPFLSFPPFSFLFFFFPVFSKRKLKKKKKPNIEISLFHFLLWWDISRFCLNVPSYFFVECLKSGLCAWVTVCSEGVWVIGKGELYWQKWRGREVLMSESSLK